MLAAEFIRDFAYLLGFRKMPVIVPVIVQGRRLAEFVRNGEFAVDESGMEPREPVADFLWIAIGRQTHCRAFAVSILPAQCLGDISIEPAERRVLAPRPDRGNLVPVTDPNCRRDSVSRPIQGRNDAAVAAPTREIRRCCVGQMVFDADETAIGRQFQSFEIEGKITLPVELTRPALGGPQCREVRRLFFRKDKIALHACGRVQSRNGHDIELRGFESARAQTIAHCLIRISGVVLDAGKPLFRRICHDNAINDQAGGGIVTGVYTQDIHAHVLPNLPECSSAGSFRRRGQREISRVTLRAA
jgi:hypothetical protein